MAGVSLLTPVFEPPGRDAGASLLFPVFEPPGKDTGVSKLTPATRRFRAYRIDAGTDLLGDWLVDVTYGRIGSRGRTVRYVADDEAAARKIIRHCLQRRATAPKRIGVPYQVRELADPGRWLTNYPCKRPLGQKGDAAEADTCGRLP